MSLLSPSRGLTLTDIYLIGVVLTAPLFIKFGSEQHDRVLTSVSRGCVGGILWPWFVPILAYWKYSEDRGY